MRNGPKVPALPAGALGTSVRLVLPNLAQLGTGVNGPLAQMVNFVSGCAPFKMTPDDLACSLALSCSGFLLIFGSEVLYQRPALC